MTPLLCLNDPRETQVPIAFSKFCNHMTALGIIAGSFLERNRIAKSKTQDATIYYQAEVKVLP